jgi:hypothetical protein
MSDIWSDFGKRSTAAVQAANDITGGLIPLALAAALGGTLADIAIRASKARFKSPWAASVVIFAIGWALLKFLPREGVRLIVAGMFGRLGPESYANVIKPLGQKFGVNLEGEAPQGKAPSPGSQGGTDGKDAAKQPALPPKQGQPAKAGNGPGNCFGLPSAANEEGWTPPASDIRPIAQGVLENRQNLYDLSGEIFNEMRRRSMVDPAVANETQGDFERLVEDVFTRMAA